MNSKKKKKRPMRMVNELIDIRGKSPPVEENPIEARAKVAVKQ